MLDNEIIRQYIVFALAYGTKDDYSAINELMKQIHQGETVTSDSSVMFTMTIPATADDKTEGKTPAISN